MPSINRIIAVSLGRRCCEKLVTDVPTAGVPGSLSDVFFQGFLQCQPLRPSDLWQAHQ